MIMTKREIHIARVMHTPVNAHIPCLHVVEHIPVRAMLDPPFTAMVNAKHTLLAGESAVTPFHMEIIEHHIYAVKNAVHRHCPLTGFIIHTEDLTVIRFYDLTYVFTKLRPSE